MKPGVRREITAACTAKFRAYVLEKLAKAGKTEADLAVQGDNFMATIRKDFPSYKTRDLLRIYHNTNKANRVQELELGAGGSFRKQGEHSILRQHTGLGIRAVKPEANRKSALHNIFMEVKDKFEGWRAAGHYVDRLDLLSEFETKLTELIAKLTHKASTSGSILTISDTKLLNAANTRWTAHQASSKRQEKTVLQMQRLFKARLLKPNRLIALTMDQEKRKVLEGWWAWDYLQWLAAFAPLELLGEHVIQPLEFREGLKSAVICMSDQMPYFIKLKPGKQIYADGEYASKKSYIKNQEAYAPGGGSQKKETLVGEATTAHLRGESHGTQDKFRITVDLEQVCYGWFNDNEEPKAGWGITSIIMTGAHFREHNVATHDGRHFWLEDESFVVDGKQVTRKKGDPVPGGLGSAILKFRSENPELFKRMKDNLIRFYQQPAAFEDAVITKWKIKEQQRVHGITLSLKDMFTGGLSESARDEMCLCLGTPKIYTTTGLGHRKNREMAGVDDLVVYMQTAVKYNTFYIHKPGGAKRPRGGVYTNCCISPPNRPHQQFPYFF